MKSQFKFVELDHSKFAEGINLVPALKQYYTHHMGVKLYSNSGFVHNENFMQYKL